MTTLNFLLAASLDPVQAALVLAIVLAYRGPQPLMMSGVAAALVTEAVMVLVAPGYVWGELIAPRIVSALLQAAVLLGCIRLAGWGARRVGAWFVSGGSGPGELAGLEAAASGGGATPIDAWHMRGYARRRTYKLSKRKMHP